MRTLQQIFTVFPLGTQVAEAATPSATPQRNNTNSNTDNNSYTSPTPTSVLSPTPTITSVPPTPTPTIVQSPTSLPINYSSTHAKSSSTGNNSLIVIGGATLVTTVIGIVLFLGLSFMKIAIIGAGFTGLTAAYALVKQGHTVTIFEKILILVDLLSDIKKKDGTGLWRNIITIGLLMIRIY